MCGKSEADGGVDCGLRRREVDEVDGGAMVRLEGKVTAECDPARARRRRGISDNRIERSRIDDSMRLHGANRTGKFVGGKLVLRPRNIPECLNSAPPESGVAPESSDSR